LFHIINFVCVAITGDGFVLPKLCRNTSETDSEHSEDHSEDMTKASRSYTKRGISVRYLWAMI